MGLLSHIAAQTLKSTGEGMSKTLREQAQEARENALLKKKMQHDRDVAQTGRDALIEAEILRDHLAGNRSTADHNRSQGRYTQGADEYGRYQLDTHTGKKDYYGSKNSGNRYHFEKITGPDGAEQVVTYDKMTGAPVQQGEPVDLAAVMAALTEQRNGESAAPVTEQKHQASATEPVLPDAAPKPGLLQAAQAIPRPEQREAFNQAEAAAIRYLRTDESMRDYRDLQAARSTLAQIAQTSTFPVWRERANELLNQLN